MRNILVFYAIIATMLVSCSKSQKQYVIGVSQCSEDIWRDKQNAELKMGAYFHDNVELRFAAAYDSDERQVQQIDSLVATGIDLLIVAPNQVATISPAIDRAYDKGIPVIVFERKTNSRKFTAFMSADNYEMGRVMGEYIVTLLGGKGTVLEIKGLEGSSPAIERHNGFMDAISKVAGIQVVGSLQGDWTEPTAYETTRQWLTNNKDVRVDLVFGANDRTAMGARKAILEASPSAQGIRYCGIDGLLGEEGGIRLVRDSILDASYIYPTHGDRLLQLAVDILEGKPYEKETALMSALVTRENARVLLLQNEEIVRQSEYLDQLHSRADNYLQQLDAQRLIIWMALGTIGLLIISIVLFYLYHRRKVAFQHERVANTLWNLKSKESETPEDAESAEVSLFVSRFKEVVEARLTDSNVSVEDFAADMNLSRVQLYRKVKSVTGLSPVEILRSARLKRAYQLLLTTEKSVSEVAYTVGFTSPSYFTKCFKDEYGKVPGEVRSSS